MFWAFVTFITWFKFGVMLFFDVVLKVSNICVGVLDFALETSHTSVFFFPVFAFGVLS